MKLKSLLIAILLMTCCLLVASCENGDQGGLPGDSSPALSNTTTIPNEEPTDPGEEVCPCTSTRTARENVIDSTCKTEGSYDEVVYCVACDKELSRTSKTIEKKTTHTAATAVEENRVEATCKEAGSYDEVVYCSVCNKELSRTSKTIEKEDHVYESAITAPTCTTKGYTTYTCHCGDTYKAEEVSEKRHDYGEWSVAREATEREDGEERRACKNCEHFETKPIYATGTEGLLFTLSQDGTSYSVSAGAAVEGDVFIPAYYNGLPVTSIGYIGFATGDVEPEEIEPGSYAFLSCTNLKTVVIPSTVTVIGDMAFAGCEGLEDVAISPAVTVIGDGAFELCKSLENIEIPSGVTRIGAYTFAGCEVLKSVVIPEGVREIGTGAFALTIEQVFDKYLDDIRVSVPDSDVILILREWQAWTSCGVEIYYFDENGEEILIADTNFGNDYTLPFRDGAYEIINNNDATFTVRAGDPEDREGWTERTFDLPQCTSVYVPKNENGLLVFYGGENIEAWNQIDIHATGNNGLENPGIYYYSETEPSEANQYWHYVDGVPTVW